MIVLATAISIGLATFISVRENLRQDLRVRLGNIAGMTALLVDGDIHQQIQTARDETSEAYLKIRSVLKKIRDTNQDIRYVYSFRRDQEGLIKFVVDAEENEKEKSHVGDVFEDDVSPELDQAFQKPYRVHVESDFSTDKWGTWLSSFAPVLNEDGSIEAVIGVDISAASVVRYENQYLFMILAVVLAVGLLAILLGLLLARQLSRPLFVLAQDMGRIQTLDLNSMVHVDSRIKEIKNMADTLEDMKKGLRSFRRYVPAELVTELISLHKEATLYSEKRNITVYFSDVADFTTIGEKLGGGDFAAYLGEYLESLTKTILAHHGTVDKYIGDAIMAFWGAPRPLERHAEISCRAALGCIRALSRLFEEWEKKSIPPLFTRIGLHTGDAMVGNFGYAERLSYTAIGDSVNLASRLEGLNKFYGTQLLISESTYNHVSGIFETRLIDHVTVKGKTQGVKVFELIAEKGELKEHFKKDLQMYQEAMLFYLEHKWSDALRLLMEVKKSWPTDTPTAIMLERCERFNVSPPPSGWSGSIVLREK